MLTWLRAVGPDTEGNLGTQAVHLLSETCLLSRKITALLLKHPGPGSACPSQPPAAWPVTTIPCPLPVPVTPAFPCDLCPPTQYKWLLWEGVEQIFSRCWHYWNKRSHLIKKRESSMDNGGGLLSNLFFSFKKLS